MSSWAKNDDFYNLCLDLEKRKIYKCTLWHITKIYGSRAFGRYPRSRYLSTFRNIETRVLCSLGGAAINFNKL